MEPDSVPYLPRGVRMHFDKVRDIWVLLAPERALKLDQIGLAILGEVDGARPLSEIAETLSAKYNAPLEQITTDSAAFLTSLADRRMLEVRP